MIAEIKSQTEYGKKGTVGVYLISELSTEPIVSFAHSVSDALEWAKEYPLYRDAIIDDMGNGIFVIYSQWAPRKISIFEEVGLIEADVDMKDVSYERSSIIIRPVNTIYENTGFQRFQSRDE